MQAQTGYLASGCLKLKRMLQLAAMQRPLGESAEVADVRAEPESAEDEIADTAEDTQASGRPVARGG